MRKRGGAGSLRVPLIPLRSNLPAGNTAREAAPFGHAAGRRIQWMSSERPENTTALAALQDRMAAFYAETRSYYAEIDFTAGAWQSDPCYRRILHELQTGEAVLEVGCGRANVLSTYPDLASRYTGVDFSRELLLENSGRFPSARFIPVTSPQELPFGDATFDRVFCMYVLEHCVFPETLPARMPARDSPGRALPSLVSELSGSRTDALAARRLFNGKRSRQTSSRPARRCLDDRPRSQDSDSMGLVQSAPRSPCRTRRVLDQHGADVL